MEVPTTEMIIVVTAHALVISLCTVIYLFSLGLGFVEIFHKNNKKPG